MPQSTVRLFTIGHSIPTSSPRLAVRALNVPEKAKRGRSARARGKTRGPSDEGRIAGSRRRIVRTTLRAPVPGGGKATDRAIRVATEGANDAMVRVLEAARAPMAEHLISMGIRLPDRKARKGGRRKKGEAA
jgi:hypothetical protein